MEETVHVNGQDFTIEVPDPFDGEKPKDYSWRVQDARSRAIRALQEGGTLEGEHTEAFNAHEQALKRLFGRHRPRTTSMSELLSEANKSRSRRRGGG